MASQNINDVVVFVGGVVETKIGTISRLLTPMVVAAAPIYERLYELKEEEKIMIHFKFSRANNVNQDVDEEAEVGAEGLVHPKELEGEVSVLCCHTHPYLDKQVWLETKSLLDTTYLKGNYY